MSKPACTGEPSAPHCPLSTPADTRIAINNLAINNLAINNLAINNLALQALIAAFTINKTIVDETFARAAITEVTTE